MTTAQSEPEPTFPLDSFKDAAIHMRRPFTAKAVKFKVQAATPQGTPVRGLIVCYIDARLAIERLNLLVPHLWHDEYEALGAKHLVCRLTVDGITRQDVGEGAGKGLYSDALKRAGVKFGVGVSLYATPAMWLDKGKGLKDANGRDGKKTLELTDDGRRKCRELYSEWLTATGIPAFGKPLDHGDVENSIGDADAESSKPITPSRAVAATSAKLSADKREKVAKAIVDAGMNPALVYASVNLANASEMTAQHARDIRVILDQR